MPSRASGRPGATLAACGAWALALACVDQALLLSRPLALLAVPAWTLPLELVGALAICLGSGMGLRWLLIMGGVEEPEAGSRASLTVGTTALALGVLAWGRWLAAEGRSTWWLIAFAAGAAIAGRIVFWRVERRAVGPGRVLGWLAGGATLAAAGLLLLLHAGRAGLDPPQAPPVASAAPGRAGRNVVLIVLDTLRRDHVGPYATAPAVSRTPEIDGFFHDGVVVGDAIAAASWTLPSVISIMTGRLPAFELQGNRSVSSVAPEVETLAEAFAGAGYATGAFVDNYAIGPHTDLWRGFAERALWRHDLQPGEVAFAPPLVDAVWNRVVRSAEPRRFVDTQSAALAEAEGFLTRHRDERFFMWVHLMSPHAPYDPPAARVGDGYEGRLHPALFAPSAEPPGVGDLQDGRFLPTAADVAHLRALYAAEVEGVDHKLAALFAALRGQGLLDHTVVVLLGDHGEELWDHGSFWHGHTLHAELVEVPLLFAIPGTSARRVNGVVSLTGLPATLLDLAGLPGLAGVDVPSFASSLTAGASPPGEAVSALYEEHLLSVRTAQHTGIWNARRQELEVYDRQADPGETRPLVDPEAGPKLRQRLVELRQRLAGQAREARGDGGETLESLRALGYL